MTSPLSTDTSLDGYQLVRFLGRGGFGEVWLCRSGATGSYHALKFISANDSDLIEKEHHSLTLYRSAASRLRSPHLVPIEHINRHEAGLYYVMPLADGFSATDPADPAWQPLSLAARIEARASAPAWFTSRDIIGLMTTLLEALQTLSDAGLVHRDVKPENILFFDGSPCLGDISLLGEDAAVITRRGTPGYATPSWYRDGLPDMYGAAATLYTLLTGNPPDKMGRAAFLWPPRGEESLPESERAEWKRLHAVVRRATEEKVGERYLDFRSMAAALSSAGAQGSPPTLPPPLPAKPIQPAPAKTASRVPWVLAALTLVLIGIGVKGFLFPKPADTPQTGQSPKVVPSPGTPSATPPPPGSEPDASTVAFEDAQLAYYSLTEAQNLIPFLDLTSSQDDLLQNTVAGIQSDTWNQDDFHPTLAVSKLDMCLDAVPQLREITNVRLARLLLLQASGDPSPAGTELDDPAFTTPRTGDSSASLTYRVRLLCRLNAADKAETLLDRVLDDQSLNDRKRSDALLNRARVRAAQGNFAGAKDDADAAMQVAGEDPALKASLEMKLLRLESDYPAYAAYLKAHQGK
jgi:serine/threonine protein kinase